MRPAPKCLAAGALVTAHNGRIVYEYHRGYLDNAKKYPVNAQSYFRISSVTKMVTAPGLMALYEDGRLQIDADIGGYLRFALRNPRYPKKAITARQLQSHTSPLADNKFY